jgi:hypothetical protein
MGKSLDMGGFFEVEKGRILAILKSGISIFWFIIGAGENC